MPLSLKYTFDAADPENESSDSINVFKFPTTYRSIRYTLKSLVATMQCFTVPSVSYYWPALSDHFDSINDRASTFYFSFIQTDQKTVMHYDNGMY